MRIALGPLPYVGGTRTHILNIAKYSSHKINLIEYSPLSFYYPRYKGKGFLIRHKIPFTDPYGYYLAKLVLSKYDVVHTHGHPHWCDIYKKPKKSKAKYIHTVHQIYYKEDYDDKIWPWFNVLNERLFQYCKEADVVISVSRWVQEVLEERGIQSVYIPNAVDLEECEKANASVFRKKYNIDKDFFIFVGSMTKLKRPNLFIELAKRMPDKVFVMIGTGTSNAELKRSITQLPENIIGLGRMDHQDVLNAIAASRVVIVPSSKETCSAVMLEGMACKKPVIATDSSGLKEVSTDKNLLFKLDNINELQEKAYKAWDDPTLGLSGYEKVKKEYDCRIVIKQIDRLYEDI
jgi:glycosyltransferase involved in cell wall biosynthesis